MRVRFASLLLLAALPAASFAQSLGEAAAKERERRKAAKGGKVITDDELRRAGTKGTYNPPSGSLPAAEASPAAPAAEGGAPAGQAGEKPKTEDELRAEQEKAWRDRLEKARAEATQLQGQVDRLQQAVNDVSGNVYGASRTRDLAALDDAKRKLATARQQITDLEEEGRRNRFR